MSEQRERERERKTPSLLDGLLLTAVAGATLYFGYQKNQENRELADTLLDVNDRETVEHFKAQQKREGKNVDGIIPIDAKLRTIPKSLRDASVKQMVQKLKIDPMWKYILGADADIHLDWIILNNMEALEKRDSAAGVSSVAWRSSYQTLLTRRYRETKQYEEGNSLDVVATFCLVHGAEVDQIFERYLPLYFALGG